MTKNIVTADDLAAIENIEGLESITEQCVIEYQPAEVELRWLWWIGDRYALTKYMTEALAVKERTSSPDVVTISLDVAEVGRLLAADGLDRAPCLSEDTQLARLIWSIGPDND
jgi:hypothetical protein